ncbi:hypothetical protein C8J56DRAFT_883374 [Mycena floridula]|nr:hypothetical protein C8J56DRAFT_883374 [Mycena floridula]
MTTEAYELLYFPVFLRADVALMAFEVTRTKYKLTTVLETWPSIKNEQQFGQLPRLTVTQADGISQHLWESGAIELYLGEKLEQILSTVILPSPELRAAKHEKHIAETIPNHLKWHEALLEEMTGNYYAGDTITLPDLVLVSLFLMYRDMYGIRNPVTKFPNIMKLVNTVITEKLAEYVEERRDAGQWKWNTEKFEFINKELERLGLA